MGPRHSSHFIAVGIPPQLPFYLHYTQLHRDRWSSVAPHFKQAGDTV